MVNQKKAFFTKLSKNQKKIFGILAKNVDNEGQNLKSTKIKIRKKREMSILRKMQKQFFREISLKTTVPKKPQKKVKKNY